MEMPTLGIPCLQGYLKENGFSDIDVWDSNLNFLHYLLDPQTLKIQEGRLNSGEVPGETDEIKARVQFTLPFVRENISDIPDIFHSKERYYQVSSYNRGINLVKMALEAYSIESDPVYYHFDYNGFSIQREDQLPFSIESLIQFVKSGNKIFWLDQFLTKKLPELEKKDSYDLVGFSCANRSQIFPVLLMASFLRKAGITKRIALGGSFVTMLRKVICNTPEVYDFFDYIVTFEGEESLLSLVRAIEEEQSLDNVPNLSFRKDGEIVQTSVKKINDLNSLPTPDFSGFPIGQYWTPEPILPVYCTRGCYYQMCEFCNHYENYFGKFRARRTEKVIADVKTYKRLYGARMLFFADEDIVPKQHVEIAEWFAKEKLEVKWYSHCRAEKYFTKERLKKLAQGGSEVLHVGMESTNTRVLKLMKKGYDREQALKFLENLRDVPMSLHINTIRAFPGEQPEEYIETLETVWNFAKVGDYVHLYGFAFIPGSPLEKHGSPYITSTKPDKENLANKIRFQTVNIKESTPEQKKKVQVLAEVLSQALHLINKIFPQECCWGGHLLYVTHYREIGKAKLMDTPLKDLGFGLPSLKAFSKQEDLSAWNIHLNSSVSFAKLPSNGKKEWFVLEKNEFSLSKLSEVLVKHFQETKNESICVKDVTNFSGLSTHELSPELYRLVRLGIIRLEKPSQRLPLV